MKRAKQGAKRKKDVQKAQQCKEGNPTHELNQNSHAPDKDSSFALYTFLQIPKTASPQQIVHLPLAQKCSYRRLVLLYHPDKNSSPDAKEQFQRLHQAYSILSDPQLRRSYDQTGSTLDDDKFQSAYEYYRTMYKPISEEDILAFSREYRGGVMEEEDLRDYYNRRKGDMTYILEEIPLSGEGDLERFYAYYERMVKEGVLSRRKGYEESKKKVRKIREEIRGEENMGSLVMAIRNKKESRMSFLEQLEEKYGVGKKKKVEKKNIKNSNK